LEIEVDLEKIAAGYDTDKAVNTHYLRNYEELFGPLRDKEIRLLELGVHKGGSLFLWRDYFPRGTIVGLDVKAAALDDPSRRIHTYRGRQEDTELLDRIARETAPGGFDVVIDDCSHIAALARVSFWHLFRNHLRSGGIYAIEDWGTGYWETWPDGAAYRRSPDGDSHHAGMVGFVKELVDEAGAGDITHPKFGSSPYRPSQFRQMRLSHGHLLIIKS
jgi:hypothetical protein